MIVQDDAREQALIERYGLRSGDGNRIGVDAYTLCGCPVELKTTSKASVSTARDLGPKHLEKWRGRYWIIATFNAKTQADFDRIYFLAPEHMEGWYRSIEQRFVRSDALIERTLVTTALSDRHQVEYLLRRGALLNDPNISMTYVRQNGIDITFGGCDQLVGLVQEFSLTPKVREPHPADEFFVWTPRKQHYTSA